MLMAYDFIQVLTRQFFRSWQARVSAHDDTILTKGRPSPLNCLCPSRQVAWHAN